MNGGSIVSSKSDWPRRRRLFVLSLLGAIPMTRNLRARDRAQDATSTPVPEAIVAKKLVLPFQGGAGGDEVIKITNLSTTSTAVAIAGYGPRGVGGLSTAKSGGQGIVGAADGAGAAGVVGISEGGRGVYGGSDMQPGVYGFSGGIGVKGVGAGGIGVQGIFRQGTGPKGFSTLSADPPSADGLTRGSLGTEKDGVQGESDVAGGRGVLGRANNGNAVGVFGESTSNVGVHGQGPDGVRGVTASATGAGMVGVFKQGGKDSTSDPRDGETRGMLGTAQNGVQGESKVEGGKGVAGKANVGANAAAVYGESTDGFAGFFRGKVTITERLLIGRIDAKEVYASIGLIGGLGKLFKIDHPLHPENKFLLHSSIESPERRNMYEGVVTLDEAGTAWVTLPDWFEALNTDFRYQLTCVGGYSPVFIAKEIQGNRFQIAGGKQGLKVCWQVTGTRQDALAKAHPFRVEEEKSESERGKYLNPTELGFPQTLAIHQMDTAAVRSLDETVRQAD